MNAHRDALTKLIRLERLRSVRNWAFAAGVALIALAIASMGAGFTNPKWSSNAYVIFGITGNLAWFAVLVSYVAALIPAIALVTTIVIASLERHSP